MASEIISRDPRRVLFREWLRDVDVVLGRDQAWYPGGVFGGVLEAWRRVLVEPRELCSWYRSGGHEEIRPRGGDPVWAYVARCMGHRLDRRAVLGCPRVAVLCAWAFYDGRWLDCEVAVFGDRVACYLYAGVRGGLPRALHNQLVLEGGEVAGRYLMDFCGSGSIL